MTKVLKEAQALGDDHALIQYEDLDGVVRLTLNQPSRRNALSRALLMELRKQLELVAGSSVVRVVIVAAAGPVFSAGHDLRELRAATPEQTQEIFSLCTEVMQKLTALPQPVIAQVQGLATAAGCQLAASCDLIVAATTASFATPGVKVGLFCTTPSVPLFGVLPEKKLLEMLLTGEPLSAEEAKSLGLVNQVYPPERLAEATLTLARHLAMASSQVLAEGKRSFYRLRHLERTAAYAEATCLMATQALAPPAREGMAAFLEKRPPRWPA
jgi:enoyl-CoA hydratase/carnithine racemase